MLSFKLFPICHLFESLLQILKSLYDVTINKKLSLFLKFKYHSIFTNRFSNSAPTFVRASVIVRSLHITYRLCLCIRRGFISCRIAVFHYSSYTRVSRRASALIRTRFPAMIIPQNVCPVNHPPSLTVKCFW